jgi:hypothetical protein
VKKIISNVEKIKTFLKIEFLMTKKINGRENSRNAAKLFGCKKVPETLNNSAVSGVLLPYGEEKTLDSVRRPIGSPFITCRDEIIN